MTSTQLTGPSWDQAACAGKDTEMFFPEGPKDFAKKIADAKAVCSGCPITAQCFSWAIENDEEGIWGGTTYRERQLLRRGRVPVTIRTSKIKEAATSTGAPQSTKDKLQKALDSIK